MIVACVKDLQPEILSFWGVGMAGSDVDLLDLYRSWSRRAALVNVINPDINAIERFETKLKREVRHFDSHKAWADHGEHT